MAGFSDATEVDLRTAMFRTNTVTVRANSTLYALGARVVLATGVNPLNIYECITSPSGTSAGSQGAFNTALGSTTTDAGVTWLTLLPGYPKRPIWVSLHTSDPTDAGTGGTEVSGGSYARVSQDPLDANWSAPDATGGVTRNVLPITFPAPTGAWGLISFFGLWDSVTLGRLIISGAVAPPKTVDSGDPAPLFPASSLVLTFD
jgi:hypothetical protein